MFEPIGQASAAVIFLDKVKSFIAQRGPTKLSIIGIDQEWRDGQLIHHYKLRVNKPKHSKSASKSPINLNIPKSLDVAEVDLDLPGIQIGPIKIPASKLSVTSHELIGDYLKDLHDEREIPMSLRLPCPAEEVLQFYESKQEGRKTYHIVNPNNFHVKSCDIERPVLLTDCIREIEIVKKNGEIVSHRLVRLNKTYSVDFDPGKIGTYFPNGIKASDNAWFKKEDKQQKERKEELHKISDRAEPFCMLRFTLDLDAHDEIEIRLYFS